MSIGGLAGSRDGQNTRRVAQRLALGSASIFFVLLLVVVGAGIVTSYSFSRSAENESSAAINSFDLRGDLRSIGDDLNLLRVKRSVEVESDLNLAIAGARQGISELQSVGYRFALLTNAINASRAFTNDAERQNVLIHDGSSIVAVGPGPQVLSTDAVADLVDRAATKAEQSAHQAAQDGRIGGIVSLLLVVFIVAIGLLWRSRQHQIDAVSVAQAEERTQFEAIIQSSKDLFFLIGVDNQMQYCSPSAAQFFGMSSEAVCQTSLAEFIHPEDCERSGEVFTMVKGARAVGPFDVRLRHRNGDWRILETTGNDLSIDSAVQATAWHSRDVTNRRGLEDQLARQAFEDPLTGLANRALFHDRLGHALARLSRSRHLTAVLLIDLDGFKAINDILGHDGGDDALREIGARIARSARPGDTVARIGRDEFTVLVESIDDASFADEIADRILEIVRQPLTINNVSLRVSASIGIAIASSAGISPESLLCDADIAKCSAKADGRDRRERFQPIMHTRAHRQLQISQHLAHALERRELVVHYQPSVSLEGERPEGVEALVRWNHSELGLVSPNVFIPVSEQNGLIVPIGRWVLEQACEQAVAWRNELVTDDTFKMSVNVSGRQLNHASLIPDVRSILNNSGLDPANLVLEITESVLMNNIELVIERLSALKELGISIAIDDFGTGYSSLAYLRQLPIDILKIDKTFVDASTAGEPGGDAIIRAIIDLSAALNLKTIAEGVEQMSQALHIKELGCQSAQGFLFSRPMPPDELWSFFAAKALDRHPIATGR
jgi:diguanylate cyclase (GGDEF)-like protein/PAS domain S-box-containing protein